MKPESENLLAEFLEAFEDVFDKDWQHTKEMLGILKETAEQRQSAEAMGLEAVHMIEREGTFLNPRVDDETEDWGNRGRLLSLYRKLKATM